MVADMGRGFLCTGMREDAVVVVRVRGKRAFARGWGKNAEMRRMNRKDRGRIPQKSSFFMMVL